MELQSELLFRKTISRSSIYSLPMSIISYHCSIRQMFWRLRYQVLILFLRIFVL